MKVKVLKLDNTASDVDFNFEVKSSENLEQDLGVIARVKAQAKTRSEVRGHSAKPFKQKGTGRGRQGSTKGPHFVGGGIAHGPRQDYSSLKLNRKYKSVALKRFLADYISNEKLSFVDLSGKTDAKSVRNFFSNGGKTLVVYSKDSIETLRAVRNMPHVDSVNVQNLSASNVINYERVLVDVLSKEELLNKVNN
jgi:large subunit ribosomal protein L4